MHLEVMQGDTVAHGPYMTVLCLLTDEKPREASSSNHHFYLMGHSKPLKIHSNSLLYVCWHLILHLPAIFSKQYDSSVFPWNHTSSVKGYQNKQD